jgi:hypothetical protein
MFVIPENKAFKLLCKWRFPWDFVGMRSKSIPSQSSGRGALPPMHEGQEAADAFKKALGIVLSVPKERLEEMERKAPQKRSKRH